VLSICLSLSWLLIFTVQYLIIAFIIYHFGLFFKYMYNLVIWLLKIPFNLPTQNVMFCNINSAECGISLSIVRI